MFKINNQLETQYDAKNIKLSRPIADKVSSKFFSANSLKFELDKISRKSTVIYDTLAGLILHRLNYLKNNKV